MSQHASSSMLSDTRPERPGWAGNSCSGVCGEPGVQTRIPVPLTGDSGHLTPLGLSVRICEARAATSLTLAAM